MPDKVIMPELVGSQLVRYDDEDGNLLWDVHLLCTDGETRTFQFISEEVAEGFVLTYCESTTIAEGAL